jgi:spermidine synthase
MWQKDLAGQGHKVRALFLGGGSYTFPRWVEHYWPGSECLVAEIDPVVVDANYHALGLRGHDENIRTVIGDARIVVDDLPAEDRYDLIYGDAFNDFNAPWHLTTKEFCDKLNAHLAPGGVYLANVIDDWNSALMLGAYVETMSRVFAHVYVFTTNMEGVKAGRETYVVAGSNVALDISGFTPEALARDTALEVEFSGTVLMPEDLRKLHEKCGGRVLTDDNAPVDLLIAPVVRSR